MLSKILDCRGTNWNPNYHPGSESSAGMKNIKFPCVGVGKQEGFLGHLITSQILKNPSFAIRAGGSNKGDSSESDLAEFESITRQSCFNFQAILNLSLSNASRRMGLRAGREMQAFRIPRWTSFFCQKILTCPQRYSQDTGKAVLSWAPAEEHSASTTAFLQRFLWLSACLA